MILLRGKSKSVVVSGYWLVRYVLALLLRRPDAVKIDREVRRDVPNLRVVT